MKKILRTLFFLGVATALSACSDYEENDTTGPATDKLVPVHFTAINPDTNETPESRTGIDIDDQTKRFVSRWDDQDRMAMYYACGDAMDAVAATYDATTKKFTAQLPDLTGAWNYMTFAPYFDQPLKADGTGFQAPFGNHRTQKGNNFNYLFDPLVLKAPISTTNSAPGKDDQGNELTFDLARLTSILKYEIRGGSDPIKALLLTADKTISSSYYYGGFDGTGSYALNKANEDPVESNIIAMTFEGPAPTAAELDAYFNLPPAQYGSLQLDVITANNTMGTLTLTDPASADGGFVAGELYRLKANAPSFAAVAAPSFEWPDQDMDAVHEIIDENDDLIMDYPVAVTIEAPAGIAGLHVTIESAILNDPPLELTQLDLFNQSELPGLGISFKSLGLSCKTEVQYKKSTVFDITSLVPLIKSIGAEAGSQHTFTVQVTDLAGNTTTQSLRFIIPVLPTITYSKGAWDDMATFALTGIPSDANTVAVQYKAADETTWHDAVVSADRTVAVATPQWTEYTTPDWTTNEAANAKPYKRIVPNTGIIRGKTYQHKLIVDGKEYAGTDFTAAATGNPAIQSLGNTALSCYTTDNKATDWWGSANNSFAKNLCTPYAALNCALLKAESGGLVAFVGMAPGNLFTGTFQRPSTNGTVYFGKPYAWQSRPKAVKIRYDAKIGVVNLGKHGWKIQEGKQDYARIFVAIVNWENTRNVTSGASTPTGCWDPETTTDPSSDGYGGGQIVAYASRWIDQTALTGNLAEEEIPFNWYYPEINPSSANYSIVISCATSAYGDFLNGGKSNELYVGDFEWVY